LLVNQTNVNKITNIDLFGRFQDDGCNIRPNEARRTTCQCFDSNTPIFYIRKGNLEDRLALKSSYNDSDSSETVKHVGSFPQGIGSASGRGQRGAILVVEY